MTAGSTVALCKGGRWTGSSQTLNNAACEPDPACPLGTRRENSCVPSTTCDLRDYQASWGGATRPAIQGANTNVTIGGGTVGNSNGYRILNLAFTGNGSTDGINPRPISSDWELCNNEISNFHHLVYFEFSSGDCTAAPTSQGYRRHYYRGNRFLNGGREALLTEDWDSEVDGNYFSGSPTLCDPLNHTVYTANNYCRQRNFVFKNNEVHQTCNGSTAVYSSKASTGFVYENNLIDVSQAGTSGYMVALTLDTWDDCVAGMTPAYGNVCGHQNPTIRGNRIITAHDTGIGLDHAPGALIENNLIVFAGGTIDGAGIKCPWHPGYTNAPACTGVVTRNNTIYVASGSGSVAGISVGNNTGRMEVYNNTIVRAGGAASLTCLEGNATTITGFGSNHCYGYSSLGYGTGWITTAPQFTNPGTDLTTADFTPIEGSPLADAGTTASTCTVRGAANQPCYAPTEISPSPWSGVGAFGARDVAPEIGAFER
jgi:hypothetical protein